MGGKVHTGYECVSVCVEASVCLLVCVCVCVCDVVKILLGKHIVLGQGSEPGWLHTCHYF